MCITWSEFAIEKKKWHLKESKTDTVVLTIALYAMCRPKTVESVSGKENVM